VADGSSAYQRPNFPKNQPSTSLYEDRNRLGVIVTLTGRAGFEAYTADDHCLGLFPTPREAAAAITMTRPWVARMRAEYSPELSQPARTRMSRSNLSRKALVSADAECGLSHTGLPLKRKFRPRCCAKTRAGAPCIMRVVPGKRRCRFHGGLSTGPKTKAGRARIAEVQRQRARTNISVAVE
jgi:hypothetical protein